jgi:hypothetical protein
MRPLVLIGPLLLTTTVVAPAAAEMYKMTMPIAPGIATPDEVETSMGTLKLHDGVPSAETAEAIYDNLDRSRALQAYLLGLPIVNQIAMRNALREYSPVNTTDVRFVSGRQTHRRGARVGSSVYRRQSLVGCRVLKDDKAGREACDGRLLPSHGAVGLAPQRQGALFRDQPWSTDPKPCIPPRSWTPSIAQLGRTGATTLAVPTIASRDMRAASSSSLNLSVLAGRSGSTM